MDKEVFDRYMKAGKIAARARQEAEKALKPGLKILDLANLIEESIKKQGAEMAFPVNISINEVAAHYTPVFNDATEIREGDLVKVDIGTMVDGYIGDLAFTYCSEKNRLADASKRILEAGIKAIKPGVRVGEIGTIIEEKAKELGVGLIVNLTGHTLGKFIFHGSPSIPNVKNDSGYSFKEGSVIALEPFVAETNGFVKESGVTEIYSFVQERPVRLTEARAIMQMAREQYHGLPFAKRWLYSRISPVKVSLALRQLERAGAVEPYPVLREMEGKKIAQSEHTIIVKEKHVVTTEMED